MRTEGELLEDAESVLGGAVGHRDRRVAQCLHMDVLAGERIGDLRKAGLFLVGFGTVMPLAFGAMGALLGTMTGLSVAGATILATMAASASYIAAPPAVRMNLPEANPTYSLTLALLITFPFNLLIGIPVYHLIAERLAS